MAFKGAIEVDSQKCKGCGAQPGAEVSGRL